MLREIKSIDAAGDGIYVGGNSSTGRLTQYFSVEDCYVEAPGRNCYSVVGAYIGALINRAAFNEPMALHTAISAHRLRQPDGSD